MTNRILHKPPFDNPITRCRRFRRRCVLFFLIAAAFVVFIPYASAADDASLTSDRISFFSILLDGAEWPGLLIGILSLASVTIIFEHLFTIRRATMVPDAEVERTRALIESRKFNECLEQIRSSRTMFADVLTAALRHGRHGYDAMHEAADERAGAWSSRLFRRVEYLHIIGNLAPLLGLLGTVLGMIEAFGAMQAAHGAYKPEHLAGGISLALVNTFLGLAVAIVGLGFFGFCRNRVDALTVAAHAEAIDILEYFRPAPTNQAGGGSQGTKQEA